MAKRKSEGGAGGGGGAKRGGKARKSNSTSSVGTAGTAQAAPANVAQQKELNAARLSKPLNLGRGRQASYSGVRRWIDQAGLIGSLNINEILSVGMTVFNPDCIDKRVSFEGVMTDEYRINWSRLLTHIAQVTGKQVKLEHYQLLWKFLCLGRLPFPTNDSTEQRSWKLFDQIHQDVLTARNPIDEWFSPSKNWDTETPQQNYVLHSSRKEKIEAEENRLAEQSLNSGGTNAAAMAAAITAMNDNLQAMMRQVSEQSAASNSSKDNSEIQQKTEEITKAMIEKANQVMKTGDQSETMDGATVSTLNVEPKNQDPGFLYWVRIEKGDQVASILKAVQSITDKETDPVLLSKKQKIVEDHVGEFYKFLEKEWADVPEQQKQLSRLQGQMLMQFQAANGPAASSSSTSSNNKTDTKQKEDGEVQKDNDDDEEEEENDDAMDDDDIDGGGEENDGDNQVKQQSSK